MVDNSVVFLFLHPNQLWISSNLNISSMFLPRHRGQITWSDICGAIRTERRAHWRQSLARSPSFFWRQRFHALEFIKIRSCVGMLVPHQFDTLACEYLQTGFPMRPGSISRQDKKPLLYKHFPKTHEHRTFEGIWSGDRKT